MPVEIWLLVIGAALSSVSQVVLKRGADREIPSGLTRRQSLLAQYLNVPVVLGYGLLLISMGLAIIALAKVDLKYAAIIEALGYAMVMILSRVFLHEPMTRRKIVGNLVIMAGVLVFGSTILRPLGLPAF